MVKPKVDQRRDQVVSPPPLAWLRREWAITVVLVIGVVGLVLVAERRFRPGTVLLASAVILAGWLRALLPERIVGLLRLRSRFTDVVVLGILGIGTAVLALAVPSAR